MAEKQECGGNEKYVGRKKTLDECAHSCRGTTSMFIYGTNDFGERKCGSSGCYCFCELSSTAGKCNQVSHNGYRLYKYESVNIGKVINNSCVMPLTIFVYQLLFSLQIGSW